MKKIRLKTLLAYEKSTGKNANVMFAKNAADYSFSDMYEIAFIFALENDPTTTYESVGEIDVNEIGKLLQDESNL